MVSLRALIASLLVAVTVGVAGADEPPPPQQQPPATAPPAPPPAPPTTPTPPSPREVPFKGQILRRGDRVPMAGVSVILDDGAVYTSTTDAEGRFAFPSVPPGKHTLHLRGTELAAALDLDEELSPNKSREVTYFVNLKQRYSTTVRGQAVVRETVEQTLTTDEIKHIPGTQGDTLKSVQNLPGVARSAFGGGLLIVWGSAPQDTRTYVDGVYIPTLYHFGGLRSTVNGEMVGSLSFLPGGYGVDFGRGLGGVVEVESRKPRTDGFHGFVQADLIDGSLSLEGPIAKNLSFAVAARRSWIDVFLPLFTSNAVQLSPRYYDYQAALHYTPTPRDDVDLFLFGSDDTLSVDLVRPDPTLSAAINSHIFYHRLLLSWRRRFWKRATFTTAASVGYDVPFQIKATFGQSTLAVDAETFEYTLRATARLPITDTLRVDAGLDFEGNAWFLSATVPTSGMPREGDSMNFGGMAAFVTDKTTLYNEAVAPFVSTVFTLLDRRLLLSPALRLEVLDVSGYKGTPDAFSHLFVRAEPRMSARFKITSWLDVKGAIGVYHQLPDAGSYLKLLGNTSIGPEQAWHYVLGFDLRPPVLGGTLDIQVEGFYKDLRDLVVRGERPGDPTLVNDGIGRVVGAEIIVRQQLWKGFFGWIAYTVSRSERKDHPDQDWRPFQYDQTHILTLIASYKFSRGYQIGLRYRYVTGNPTTPVATAFADLNTDMDRYTPVYGPLFSSRLASFQQLDIRFDKLWTFDVWRLSLYIDIQNVTNASNPEMLSYSFDYKQSSPVAGLPFLPVVGLRGDF